MDKYNAFTFEMDLFIRVLMVPFGWSQFEAANWALANIDLLENRL
jgi:hypothetical protein